MTPEQPQINTPSEFPWVECLPSNLSSQCAFQRLSSLPHVVFFDSAQRDEAVGRYSFVAADPFDWIERPADGSKALAVMERVWQSYRSQPHPELPPFQGGLAGLWSYELARSLESIAAAPIDDLPMPTLAVGCYDTVVAFDHYLNRAWIVSQGFPETDPQARRQRAAERLRMFQKLLCSTSSSSTPPQVIQPTEYVQLQAKSWDTRQQTGSSGIFSNMSATEYRKMVARAIEYIHAGDLFQVNLSQRLVCRPNASSYDLYLRLRQCNPAPYAAFLDVGSAQICSASPECFLTVRDRQVESRPIKGTRRRSPSPEADLFTGDVLQQSEKDRAENVMIVDLMRNDLSRVCTADSVHVAKLCQLETFAYVKHLVSVVRGTLKESASPIDLLRACFPGGSITGAPKIRAMQIIAEQEPTTRGAYCGCLGYLGFDGQLDTSILIRTITAAHGWWQFPVGGGIVAQSTPEEEYQETWHKARGLLEAIQCSC